MFQFTVTGYYKHDQNKSCFPLQPQLFTNAHQEGVSMQPGNCDNIYLQKYYVANICVHKSGNFTVLELWDLLVLLCPSACGGSCLDMQVSIRIVCLSVNTFITYWMPSMVPTSILICAFATPVPQAHIVQGLLLADHCPLHAFRVTLLQHLYPRCGWELLWAFCSSPTFPAITPWSTQDAPETCIFLPVTLRSPLLNFCQGANGLKYLSCPYPICRN